MRLGVALRSGHRPLGTLCGAGLAGLLVEVVIQHLHKAPTFFQQLLSCSAASSPDLAQLEQGKGMALRWRVLPSCSSKWDACAYSYLHSTHKMEQQRSGLLACSADGWAKIIGFRYDPPLCCW